jgi:hypothetical protein
MLQTMFLAWTLLVHVQLDLCDKAGCQPHPSIKEAQGIVATVPTETECLTLQIQTQAQLNAIRNRRPRPTQGQRHIESRAKLRCVPEKEG